MPIERPRSAPLAALATVVALGAMLSLARHHQRARALAAAGSTAIAVTEPEPLPTVEALLAPIDVNHASAADLERLPRIGPALAARIIAHRPFATLDELVSVPGIGPRTVEALREHAEVTPLE